MGKYTKSILCNVDYNTVNSKNINIESIVISAVYIFARINFMKYLETIE